MITLVTSNIRFDNPKDAPNDWRGRRTLLSEYFNNSNADLIGTQEGRKPQLDDLLSLIPQYQMASQHREWIDERMYPTIFYNPKSVSIIRSGDIWLSETPLIAGSSSFDSSFPRLCSWVEAYIHSEKSSIFYVNTHLDHIHSHTREGQISVLIEEVTKLNNNLPVILAGDFNDSPTGIVRQLINQKWGHLCDSWEELGLPEESTFHKFGPIPPNGDRIDWILHDPRLKIHSLEIFKGHHAPVYPSDHFPIKAELIFSGDF